MENLYRYAIDISDEDTDAIDLAEFLAEQAQRVVAIQYHQATAAFFAAEGRYARDARAPHAAIQWQRESSAHYAAARFLLDIET